MNIYENLSDLSKRKISGKMGIHTQLLITVECKTIKTELSSTLVKYLSCLVISININENYRSKRKFAKKKNKSKKKSKGLCSYLRILLPSYSTFKWLNLNIHGYYRKYWKC